MTSGKIRFLNLPVGHDVDRFELVVGVKGPRDFRQVFARKRLATGKNQHAEVAAERFGDALDFVRLHLELLARAVVKLVSEEAVCTAHIAN